MSEQKPSGTARGTAVLRALANREFNDEQLGTDYMAEYFLPFLLRFLIKAKGFRKKVKDSIPPGMYEYLTARTAYFDKLFVDALKVSIPQIVLLGAGYDTRAYRFSNLNKGTKIVELDAPETQNLKKKILEKSKIEIPGNVVFISLNFDRDSLETALVKSGCDNDKRTLFILEGVSYYLNPESIDDIFEIVNKYSHSESGIALDYVVSVPEEKLHNYYGVSELLQAMEKRHPNEKGKFSIEEEQIESFFKQRGLKIIENLTSSEIENRFLTSENGSTIGKITEWFRFVMASPTGAWNTISTGF